MSTSTALVTVAEFLKLPEPKEGRLELRRGEVISVPPPRWRHRDLQDRLATVLRLQLGHLGRVFWEMPFQPTLEYEAWEADVGFLRNERVATLSEDKYLEGAPDLVVEVLSPRDTMREMEERRTACMANGCKSFWIVDDRLKTISVTEAGATKDYGAGSKLSSLFLAEDLSVDDLLR